MFALGIRLRQDQFKHFKVNFHKHDSLWHSTLALAQPLYYKRFVQLASTIFGTTTAINPFFPLIPICIMCSILYAAMMLFEINRFEIKALCVGDIIWGSTFFNLFESTFETNLYRTLQRLIGRNSITHDGFFIFRIAQYGSN